MEHDIILDDIWAEEEGISVRFVLQANGSTRIELTGGVGSPALASATLTRWRSDRALAALIRGVTIASAALDTPLP